MNDLPRNPTRFWTSSLFGYGFMGYPQTHWWKKKCTETLCFCLSHSLTDTTFPLFDSLQNVTFPQLQMFYYEHSSLQFLFSIIDVCPHSNLPGIKRRLGKQPNRSMLSLPQREMFVTTGYAKHQQSIQPQFKRIVKKQNYQATAQELLPDPDICLLKLIRRTDKVVLVRSLTS